MVNDSSSSATKGQKLPLGDRIRAIAHQLREEDQIQIQATSNILGAAAQIAQNHDRLIDEVVDMVEEDLEASAQMVSPQPYTVEQLKREFGTLKKAKAHFNIKAKSWKLLITQLNKQHPSPTSQTSTDLQPNALQPKETITSPNASHNSVSCRLDRIETELQTLRNDVNRALQLLEQVVVQLS